MEAAKQSQHQDNQQVSFHFWNCQLTEASPKYSWDPENWSGAAAEGATGERRQRRGGRAGDGDGSGDASGGEKEEGKVSDDQKEAAENGHKNGNSNGQENDEEDGEEDDEAAIDADYMQHVLKVNACILGPKATGIHLVSVRTKCYQSEPDNCPIVCIDPASQRTLALGYEFVLDSQNEVTFELTEGAGPVWLTGLHQVRVHDAEASEHAYAEGEEVEEMASDESMNEIREEEEEDADEEEEEEEEEDEEEEIRPPQKRVARASKSERPVPSPRQQSRRAPAKTGKSAKAKSLSPSPPPKQKATKPKAAAAAVGGKRGGAADKKPKVA